MDASSSSRAHHREPWNKGKLSRELALVNLGLDSRRGKPWSPVGSQGRAKSGSRKRLR